VRPAPINVRFVAASQCPLAGEVAKGRFRADLAARLAGLTIRLPALVERRDEVPGLFMQLLASRLGSSLPAIDAPLVERLMLHDWPGNVRELDLLVRRLLGLHGNEPQLSLAHLAGTELAHAPAATDAPMPAESNSTLPREERELKALLSALKDCGGNLTRAASRVRISRQRAYRLLQEQSKVSLEALRKRRLQ
jgi:DNA-binding NtrC family response regulator